MNKEIWRVRWLTAISELTNLDLQLKMWLDENNANPHWGFVEFMCCYFDDVFCGETYQDFLRDKWLTEAEYSCVKQWHDELLNYHAPNANDYDDVAVLNDPKWRNIVALGAKVRQE